MFDDVRQWLGTRDGTHLIRKVAVSVLYEMSQGGLLPPCLEVADRRNMSQDELLDECCAEISLFLVERLELVRAIMRAPGTQCAALLKTAVVNDWRARLRSPRRDPLRYLYKRAGDVLRSEGRTTSYPSRAGKGIFYGFGQKSVIAGPLTNDDLQAIALPSETAPEIRQEAVGSRRAILLLAEHFWCGISFLWNDSRICVPVWDLISWIAIHVDLRRPGETIRLEDISNLGISPRMIFDPDRVKQWAQQCGSMLTQRQGECFYLSEGEGLGLEAIARRVGYRSASGSKYALDQALETIRFFLRDLPWVSPEDLDEEAFSIFREELLGVLKSNLREP